MLRPFARSLTPSLLPMSRNIAIFNVFVIKTKLWLVRSIINTESSETGSLIKIHCKLWEIWEPNSPIFLNACQWTKLALLAFLSKRHREILARSFPDFSRTTGQERTPRD